jgi:hypothetical protein
MAYIVSPLEETDLHIDIEQFVEKLRAAWPGVQVQESSSTEDPFVIHWSLEEKKHRLLGSLYGNLHSILIEALAPDATRFALWYRTLVPNKYKLFLYDEGFNEHVELTTTSTETQVLAALNSL